jgi:hypothetical protein
MREDMEHDAFMYGLGREDDRERECIRYSDMDDDEDEEPAIEDWQLATLEDVDEQQQMEIAAATAVVLPRKPAGSEIAVIGGELHVRMRRLI